jgi:hypothetical protein
MIVDRGEVETEENSLQFLKSDLPHMNLIHASVDQVVIGFLEDLPLDVHLVVVGQAVHFVHEHFELDVRIDFVRANHVFVQFTQCFREIVLQKSSGKIKIFVTFF